MERRRTLCRSLCCLAIFLVASRGGRAESYNEGAKLWFINTLQPNWTCSDTTQSCTSPTPNHYTFNGLYTIRHGGTFYAYVQGSGSQGPCKAALGGDNFCVFTAPDTAPGWTGTSLDLRKHVPRPDDGWFWQVRSAFFDASSTKFFLMASRTASGNTATIDQMDAMVGESTDGISFTWTTLMTSLRSQINVRLEDYVLIPHPSQPRIWIGTLGFTDSQARRWTTPWKVDWNTRLVHLRNGAGVWQQLPFGSTLTGAPHATERGRITHFQLVNVGGVGRIEAWGVAETQASGVSNNPCAPGYPNGNATALYLASRANPQQSGGAYPRYRIFDPSSLSFTTPWSDVTAITSGVRALPSDYKWALSWMATRFDSGGREYLYTGSKDNAICTEPLIFYSTGGGNPWAGSGILVTRIDYVP